jgi:hypothetical protein
MRTFLALILGLTISANAHARCTDRYAVAIHEMEKIIRSAESGSTNASVGGMVGCWIIGGAITAVSMGTAAPLAIGACGGVLVATSVYGSHRQATADEQKAGLDLARQGQIVLIQAEAGNGAWVETAIAKMRTQNPELIDIPNEFTYQALNEANEKNVFCGGYYLATTDEMMAYVAKYLDKRTNQIADKIEQRRVEEARRIQKAKDDKAYAVDYVTQSLYHQANREDCLKEMRKNATMKRMVQQALVTAETKGRDHLKDFEVSMKRFCDQSNWEKDGRMKVAEIQELVLAIVDNK